MSVKHVKDYYLKITQDYHNMTQVLQELEKSVADDKISELNNNIPMIKQQVAQLKENYLRISYIMFLLNMPNRKEKRAKYVKREHKKIDDIPKEHQLIGVLREDKSIIDNLKSFIPDTK